MESDAFREAHVIGQVPGNHRLGIGDAWLALRIEAMIAAGMLQIVSDAQPQKPLYHRILRKCK